MGASSQGGQGDPERPHDEADQLIAMISELAEHAESSPVPRPWPDADPADIVGSGGQAQENRSIRLVRARLACERARLACDGLHEVAVRARAVTEGLRAQRALREARLELTAAERSTLAGLWTVVPRPERASRSRGLVVELLGYACSIPGVAHAGITVWGPRRVVAWAEASDEVARALSIVQSVIGGPGRDAADTAAPVHTGLLPDAGREWGRFGDAAVDLGVRTVFSVPVNDGGRVGSLDLYTGAPVELEERTRDLARLLGRYAGIALRRHALAAVRGGRGAAGRS